MSEAELHDSNPISGNGGNGANADNDDDKLYDVYDRRSDGDDGDVAPYVPTTWIRYRPVFLRSISYAFIVGACVVVIVCLRTLYRWWEQSQ
jgi:hypothetical protein